MLSLRSSHGHHVLQRHDGDRSIARTSSREHPVPSDISVVGFDDIHLAQFVLPPLTTIQMSCKELATAAVQALRAGIEPGHLLSEQKEWPIATHLVVRQSTSFPRGSLPALAKTESKTHRSAIKH